MSNSRHSGFIEGLLIGGLFGVTAGILLAPRAGEEIRKEIGDKAQDAYTKMQQTLRESRDAIEIAVAQGKDMAIETREEVMQVLDEAREKIEDIE